MPPPVPPDTALPDTALPDTALPDVGSVALSVLDLSPVPDGGDAGTALRGTLALARTAERAGYRRFWVAEHHLMSGVASASPPVLVALLAAATSRIRVGSAATLLPGHAPLHVAEQFGTVAAVHPGRVDLGLGRLDLHRFLALARAANESGPPAPVPPARDPARPSARDLAHDPAHDIDGVHVPAPFRPLGPPTPFVRYARLLGLSVDDTPPDYGALIDEIRSYLAGTATAPDGDGEHTGEPLTALPAHGADLDVWVLGSSPGTSAAVAGARGLPFAAAYHAQPSATLAAIEAYRNAFRPGALPCPYVAVSADVVVADTDAAARRLAAPFAEWVLGIRSGAGARPYRTPDQAAARDWTDAERAAVLDRTSTQFVGDPDAVADRLAALARVSGADEVVVTTITTDPADRARGLELLAQAWSARSVRAAVGRAVPA